MRTTIILDDDLMNTALKLSRLKTEKSAIEEGLKLLIQVSRQGPIKNLRGELSWTSDLNTMRTDR